MTASRRANGHRGECVRRAPLARRFCSCRCLGNLPLTQENVTRRRVARTKAMSNAAGEGARPAPTRCTFLHHSRDSYNFNT